MTQVLDILYPIAQGTLIVMIVTEYRRRRRANDFADYEQLKVAYLGIALFSFVILIVIAGYVFDLAPRFDRWIPHAKWALTILILIRFALYVIRIRKIKTGIAEKRQVEN